jgi:chromatin remodeling complex protein RSC6
LVNPIVECDEKLKDVLYGKEQNDPIKNNVLNQVVPSSHMTSDC